MRQEKEKSEFEKLGYFTDANGVKSTDLILKKPKFYDHVVKPKLIRNPYAIYFK